MRVRLLVTVSFATFTRVKIKRDYRFTQLDSEKLLIPKSYLDPLTR